MRNGVFCAVSAYVLEVRPSRNLIQSGAENQLLKQGVQSVIETKAIDLQS
jgi:hypothetical protein